MKQTLFILFLLFWGSAQAQDIPLLEAKNGKYALKSTDGKILSDWYSAIYDFELADIATVCQSTKFGAINRKGEVVVPVEKSSLEIRKIVNDIHDKFILENPENEQVKNYLNAKSTVIEVDTILEEENKTEETTGWGYEGYDDDLSPNDILRAGIAFQNEKKYQQAYDTTLAGSTLFPDNYNFWFNLSFYALFVNKPEQAIDAANKSLDLAPAKTGVITNLVLAYVMNSEFKTAKPIYLFWKERHFPDDERLCKEVFLKDIADLESAGIKHKDFKKVRVLLK